LNTIFVGLEHTRKIYGTGKENNFTSNNINKNATTRNTKRMRQQTKDFHG
jgi:hypothetical protein